MKLEALRLRDFRNLAELLLEPGPRFNVFSGDNGQGKTNLLEAIYLLGTLRSFRAGKTEELLRFGADSAEVGARVLRRGSERRLDVALAAGQKRPRVDGKPARAASYFGGFNVVLFAPEDLRLPKGPPGERRRFVDRAVWNGHPGYLGEVQAYDRILKSRNALLRQGGPAGLLEVYDEQLALAAVPLVTRRRALVAALAPRVEAAFVELTRTRLPLEVAYETALAPEEVAASLLRLLGEGRRRELARGSTSAGPHLDDLRLRLDGRPARLYASQGQLRALVLALKVAEIGQLEAQLGEAPVLLLDDVSSELDATRNAQLFQLLAATSGQTFITTTHRDHVLLSKDRVDFQVVAGTVRR